MHTVNLIQNSFQGFYYTCLKEQLKIFLYFLWQNGGARTQQWYTGDKIFRPIFNLEGAKNLNSIYSLVRYVQKKKNKKSFCENGRKNCWKKVFMFQ